MRVNYIILVWFFCIISILFAQTPGTLKWDFQTANVIYTCPAIDQDGTIYFGSEKYGGSVYDTLYSIYSDGSIKWKLPLGKGFSGSPAIASDKTIYIGSDSLYAVHPDGYKKWGFRQGGNMFKSPAIAKDGIIYIADMGGGIWGVSPNNTIKWSVYRDKIWTSPSFDANGVVYMGIDKYHYAINPDSTNEWVYINMIDAAVIPPSIGEDGATYWGTQHYGLFSRNPDGSKRWTFKVLESDAMGACAIGSNGTIYVGSGDNKLYALNPDGSIKWEFQTNGSLVSSEPLIGSEGTIFISSKDSNLYAINPDGSKKWEFNVGDKFSSAPTIANDGTIYIGSYDRKLYAIYSENKGLADSPWPKFRADQQNRGVVLKYTPTALDKVTKFPHKYNLKQNYPNPFNPSTTIDFTLPKSEFVTLEIYNIIGEEISTVVNDKLQAGNHTYQFDGSNLASGIYMYRIEAGAFHQVKKMILLR